jgi:molybdopterin synthase catalytic subunit
VLTTCVLSTVFYIAASQLRRDLFSITIAILMSSVKKCWQVSIWKRERKESGQKIHYDSISKNNTYITSNYEQRQQ